MDQRAAELIGKIIDHLEKSGGGSVTIEYNPGDADKHGFPPWFTNVFAGFEADDSPMVGAASHGTGSTFVESLSENVSDFRL